MIIKNKRESELLFQIWGKSYLILYFMAFLALEVASISFSCVNKPIAFLWALGFLFSGIFIGFLFGFPKFTEKKESETKAGTKSAKNRTLLFNNHIVDIADWLTKIIIGLTLVNLEKIPGHLVKLSGVVEQSLMLNSDCNPKGIGIPLFLFSSFLGFFGGFIFTRVDLSLLLNVVEKELESDLEKMFTVANKVVQIENLEGKIGSSQTGEFENLKKYEEWFDEINKVIEKIYSQQKSNYKYSDHLGMLKFIIKSFKKSESVITLYEDLSIMIQKLRLNDIALSLGDFNKIYYSIKVLRASLSELTAK